PQEEKAVRAHVADCADCRHALDEARQVQGLLDVHFGQQAALSRLGEKLKAETRRQPPSAPWILSLRRFAAVAALLLVTLGLGLVMVPTAPATTLGLQMSLEESLGLAPGPGERDHVQETRMAMDGPKAKAFREAERTGKWPLPPRIGLDLVVRNPGPTPAE